MKHEYGAMVEWYRQGKTEVFERNLSQCCFSQHRSRMFWPGIESVPSQWETGDLPSLPLYVGIMAICIQVLKKVSACEWAKPDGSRQAAEAGFLGHSNGRNSYAVLSNCNFFMNGPPPQNLLVSYCVISRKKNCARIALSRSYLETSDLHLRRRRCVVSWIFVSSV